jgi:ankyrin repeat protein
LAQPRELIERVVELGADVRASDNRYQTALHNVCYHANMDELIPTMQILIDNGADVGAENSDDWQPIHFLVSRKIYLPALKFLIESGADIHATTNTGATALHIATRNHDDADVTKYLLEQGADAVSQDLNSISAWDEAVIKGRKLIVQAFLEYSLDVSEQGQLNRACGNAKNFNIIKLLKEWMSYDGLKRRREVARKLGDEGIITIILKNVYHFSTFLSGKLGDEGTILLL